MFLKLIQFAVLIDSLSTIGTCIREVEIVKTL